MQQKKINRQSGISIIELLIVVMIAVVLTMMAVANFDRAKSQLERQNIAREFKTYLERARFDSVKRRAMASDPNNGEARVTITGDTSFNVALDFSQDGLLNVANETRTINFSENNGGRFMGIAAGTIISYDRRGHVTAVDSNGNSITPTFTFCSENCSSINFTPNTSNATTIAVSPTGTVLLTAGGSNVTNPSNPTLSNTSSGSDINDLTKIPSAIPY